MSGEFCRFSFKGKQFPDWSPDRGLWAVAESARDDEEAEEAVEVILWPLAGVKEWPASRELWVDAHHCNGDVEDSAHLDRSWATTRTVVTGHKIFAFVGRRAEAARTVFRLETVRRHLGTGPFVLQTLGKTQWQQLLDQAAAGGRSGAAHSVRSAGTTSGTYQQYYDR